MARFILDISTNYKQESKTDKNKKLLTIDDI